MACLTHRNISLSLPLSLLDLTLAQARQQLPAASERSRNVGFLRRGAHAQSTMLKPAPQAIPPPDVRAGYLRPSASTRENESQERRTAGLQRTGVAYGRKPRPVTNVAAIRRPSLKRSVPRAALILQERVDSLVRRSTAEISIPKTEESEMRPFHYTDEDLRDMYTDLLAHPESEIEIQSNYMEDDPVAERRVLLEVILNRMVVPDDSSPATSSASGNESMPSRTPSLAERLATRQSVSSDERDARTESIQLDTLDASDAQLDPQKTHHNILLRLIDVVRGVEDARRVARGSSSESSTSMTVSVLSSKEWDALVHAFVDDGEVHLAEHALMLMKRLGVELCEDHINDVMNVYASRGDVPAIMSMFEKFAIAKPTERQRDIHIKAHLKSPDTSFGIPSALRVLHNYEALALLPPVKSYTRLIDGLFSVKSSQHQAQAWDLFSHMRYVAHAKPDAVLYARMIRACAGTGYSKSGYAADPARALDLWTEMTTEVGYVPTVGAYSAVILACARSRKFATDAFRLAREMLDGHRDAHGNPLMHADLRTFNALLVAAKTRKDLPRARWILAEMLKINDQGVKEKRENIVSPDAETVVHIFHAYASYRPPFRRSATSVVGGNELGQPLQVSDEEQSTSQKEVEAPLVSKGRFSVTPPQTASEVLAEADALFERILGETGSDTNTPQSEDSSRQALTGPFSHVTLDGAVLNSYLSIYYMHASLDESRRLYDEVFRRTGFQHNSRSYVFALERCAFPRRSFEREAAREFADHIWKGWLEHEKTLQPRSADARMIERAHAAMIRVCSINNDLDRAMQLVRAFSIQYSPKGVTAPIPKPEMRSTRTMLFATRPLVRFTTPSEVQDDTVPPLLVPRDLEVLHHRLVAAGSKRRADLNYLTYLGYAYLGHLRKRRDETIRA